MSFFAELKRRNVFKVGIAYVVAAWLILQLTEVLTELMQVDSDIGKVVIILLIVGFVPALILAWAFELTPEGVKLEKDVDRTQSITSNTGRRLDFYIIGMLALALVYFIWEARFRDSEQEQPTGASAPTAQAAVEKTPATDGEAVNEKSIAVLPFTNRSPNPDDIYFTDGVHDDLLTQLAKIDAFSVISRTSVMEYRDTAKNMKEIASELGVANIMEGAIQRAGNRVRINVQLIDAGTDEHLWAEVYDRALTTENLFDIQSEIAQAIASALQATLTPEEIASVADVPTDSVEAYDLYLQSRNFNIGDTQIGYETAVALLEEALALDPEFKLAWVGLAYAHVNYYWGFGGDTRYRDLARQAIDRARGIDPDFPELDLAEGFYWYWGHLDYARALGHLERAIATMPGNAQAHMVHGWASRRAGLWEQAVTSMRESLRLDPRVAFHWDELSNTIMRLHDLEGAKTTMARALELDRNNLAAKTGLANINLMEGDVQSALRNVIGAQHGDMSYVVDTLLEAHLFARRYESALEHAANYPADWDIQRSYITSGEDWQATVLFLMGRTEEARQLANTALTRLDGYRHELGHDYRILNAEAWAHSILGNREQVERLIGLARQAAPPDAVEGLRHGVLHARSLAMAGMPEACVEILEPMLSAPSDTTVAMVELDPHYDSIREHPAFVAMMERNK